jgi:hypothetical protein
LFERAEGLEIAAKYNIIQDLNNTSTKEKFSRLKRPKNPE